MTENYLVNGKKLDDRAAGWRLLAATLPVTAITKSKTLTKQAGRDGHTSPPATREGTIAQFEVLVPATDWESLLALFNSTSLTITREGVSGRALYGDLRSSSSPNYYPRSGKVSAVFYVDVPNGAWRGTEVTTALTPAAAGGATLTLFAGLSAPVQDSLVRFRGPIQEPQVTDTSGAYVLLDGTIAANNFVRFDSNTGRAWLTTSDTWSGGTEVSGLIDFSGPRDVFEITPRFPTASNPASREGRLTLAQVSYGTGSGVQVRGRPAYLM